MKSNEFLETFGDYCATFSRSDAEQRAMQLRDALLTPRGLRGRHAPELERIHMARLLLALTVSDTAPKAASAVTEYAKIGAIGDRMVEGVEDLEAALVEIFKGKVESDKFEIDVKEVVVCRSWPEAIIILMDGREFKFSTLEPPVYEKRLCRIDFHISWHFFHDILSRLASEAMPERLKGKAGFERALQLKKIEQEQGPEAAQKWADEN